ncbi:XPB/Ssl2-like helicase family protein [Diaminobutyricimonas aerilata]|uniref:XPB/Ssl2-like helicase family protein n=1 Tax=Diaminobutyricimonas aerilata TaxID=1162967 RepID=A0A2M9CM78_9MICO|nr:helicase-associated domain-containing protein [Diaminobutyricimonas aerilata]PJJ73009.1 XPB/Ssl2-like helicase family protein [Diaminobutyricimonas aerilata]
MDDQALTRLLHDREVKPNGIRDVFDLADALLDRSSVQQALARLDRPTLAVLAAASAGTLDDIDDPTQRLQRLHGLALLDAEPEAPATAPLVYDSVNEQLDSWPSLGLPSRDDLISGSAPAALESVSTTDRRFIDRAAADHAFGATTAVAELLAALELQPARELHRGGMSLPDAKRLAASAGVELDAVPAVRRIAENAQLAQLAGGLWSAAPLAAEWADRATAARWTHLASAWLDRLPPELREVLVERLHAVWGEGFADYVDWFFPAGGDRMRERVSEHLADAERLGITASGAPSTAGMHLLRGEPAEAEAAMAELFPGEVEKVYLQHDLTIVSPGPLAPAIDARLRRIADVESRSLASSYRVTRQSLTRALGGGETAESLRRFLASISLTGIPQPLDYLIGETSSRYGALRVGAIDPSAATPGTADASARSYVRSDDTGLLGTVAVDQELSAIALEPVGPHRLISRFPVEVVLWSLHDARYPVVAEDAEGRTIEIERPRTRQPAPEPTDPVAALLTRLRDTRTVEPEETGQAWIARQLEQAVKARTIVDVTVTLPNGSEAVYRVEPTGLAGGRVRGRDAKADIERTLPLSHISAVTPLP